MSRFFSPAESALKRGIPAALALLALSCGGDGNSSAACGQPFLRVDPGTEGCRGERCGLAAALERAGTCPERAFTLELAEGTYTLTESHNAERGPTGLPIIVGPVTLRSAGEVSIERAEESETEPFRIARVAPAGHLELVGVTLRRGAANLGGGIYNEGRLTLSDSVVERSRAQEAGGGIYNAGLAVIEGGALRENRAGSETPGVTSGLGGGLFSKRGATAILDRTAVTENRAGDGGGVASEGLVEVRNSLFRHNRAERGGGIAVLGGPMQAIRSTWHENEARLAGGAMFVAAEGSARIDTSTISDNTSFGEGGGLAVDGSIDIVGSTIFGNWARPGGEGGGLATGAESAASSRASVIAGSRSGGDCRISGHLRTADRNLDSDDSCAGFLTAIDPLGLFHDLKDNGGDTPTHLPWDDSPVIDSRLASCDTPDQRGLARGADGDRDGDPACDLGATELRPNDRP